MGQTFLTLEGLGDETDDAEAIDALNRAIDALSDASRYGMAPRYGNAPPHIQKAYDAERAALEARIKAIRAPYEKRDAAQAAAQAHLTKPTWEGQVTEKTPGLFNQYGLESFLSMGDDAASQGLDGWFKRMTTPPRAVRRAFKRVTRSVSIKSVKRMVTPPAAVRKGLRYYGAGVGTILTGGFGSRAINKAFGLKGNEQKMFDYAAKASRIVTIGAVSIAGAGAISGSMSQAGSKGFLSFLKSTAGKKLLAQKGGSFIMKDLAKNSLFKMVVEQGGKIVAEKISGKQVPPEMMAGLPDSQPIPVPQDMDSPPMPSMVAGSSSMAPGGDSYEPKRLGEVEPYDREAVASQPQAVPFPNVETRDPDADQGENPGESVAEMLARARAEARDERGPEVTPDDNSASDEGEPKPVNPRLANILNVEDDSLSCDFSRALGCVRQMRRLK